MRRRQQYSLEKEQKDKAAAQAAAMERATKERGVRPRTKAEVKKQISLNAKQKFRDAFANIRLDELKSRGYCPLGCGKYVGNGMMMHVRWCRLNPNRKTQKLELHDE